MFCISKNAEPLFAHGTVCPMVEWVDFKKCSDVFNAF